MWVLLSEFSSVALGNYFSILSYIEFIYLEFELLLLSLCDISLQTKSDLLCVCIFENLLLCDYL